MRIPFILVIALLIGFGFLLAKDPALAIVVGGVFFVAISLLPLLVWIYNRYRLNQLPQAKVFLDGKEFLFHYETRIDENHSLFRSVGDTNTLFRGIRYTDLADLPEDMVFHIQEIIKLTNQEVSDDTVQFVPGRLQFEGITVPLQFIKEGMPCPCGNEPPHLLFVLYHSAFNQEIQDQTILGVLELLDGGGPQLKKRYKEKKGQAVMPHPSLFPETNTI